MTLLAYSTAPLRPHWDGGRVLFEITVGNERVPCAISRGALEGLRGGRCTRPADLLQRFADARERIERLALEKLNGRPVGISGRLNLWADDMEVPPPDDASVAARLEVGGEAGAADR